MARIRDGEELVGYVCGMCKKSITKKTAVMRQVRYSSWQNMVHKECTEEFDATHDIVEIRKKKK